MGERLLDRVWYGSGADTEARVVRGLLVPAEKIYAAIVGARAILYDAGYAKVHETAIPAISIGNLTVGGTGKTPIAAWIASALRDRGARPAIVSRGYGADESLVHRFLNPGVPVVEAIDRVAGIALAAAKGATVAVLDDAFQHRRARRVADLVLVSADRWTDNFRLLPAGPWREPMDALRRATVIVVTRKAASDATLETVHARLAQIAPQVPRVSVHLVAHSLVRVQAGAPGHAAGPPDSFPEELSMAALVGQSVHLIAAIGDPAALILQLEQGGATVTAEIFRDHHAFSNEEVAAIARRIGPGAIPICTLKDAVKVGNRWPREAPPLWYVSQHLKVERGLGGIERALDTLASSTFPDAPTAG